VPIAIPSPFIRLFKQLDPMLPAWPDGQDFNGLLTRHRQVVQQVERLLIRETSPLGLNDIFEKLKTSNPKLHPEVGVQEFLDALQQCPDLPVEFSEAKNSQRGRKHSPSNGNEGWTVIPIIRPQSIPTTDLAHLVWLIDDSLDQLSPIDQRKLLKQLGGAKLAAGRSQPSSDDAASRSASQSLDEAIGRVRRHGGAALARFSKAVTERCCRLICPLTPKVFESWCQAACLDFRHPVEFYVRLLARLEPELPAWPEGQRPAKQITERAAAIIIQIERIAGEGRGTLHRKDIFHQVKSVRGLSGITVKEFLDALQQSPSVPVDFILPLRPRRQKRRPKTA
jgi:hypothetical protein